MKSKLTILILVVLFLLNSIILVSAAPTVTITASPTSVKINDIITLTVTANDPNGLNTISAKLTGSYSDHNCNGVTSCTYKWYTSYPIATGSNPMQYQAKACNINGKCNENSFITVSVISPDEDNDPEIQDKSVSPATVNTGQTITIIISATDDRSITKLSYRKQGGTWNDFNCNINENPVFCENTFTITESTAGNYIYEARAVDGSNNIVTQTIGTVTVTSQPCASSDWSYTVWSSCTNSQQIRTVTKTTSCTGETGKPATTQTCYQCSDSYDDDNDNKIDYPNDPGCSSATDNDETDLEQCSQSGQNCPPNSDTKCPTGHPKCSCTGDLKRYLCTSSQTCPGTSLINNDPGLGTCCSVQCTQTQQNQTKTPCSTEGKTELCIPDANGCAMLKTCKSGYWTDCAKIDAGCIKASSCLDGTPSGRCSNQSIGRLCFDGTLAYNAICLTTPCTENWYCETFSPCVSGYKTCVSGYIDINKCNTTINKPITQQSCAYQNPATEDEFNLKLKSAIGDIESSKGEEGNAEESTSTQSALNKLLNIPRSFNLKIGFETPFILLILSLFFITIAIYYMSKRQNLPKPKEIKTKEVKKEETHSVKVNDLLLSVIESLEGDERKIVDKLIEMEGIRVNRLRDILGMNKTKLEIALSKLEKRQIIKERADDNSKLFFNDWLK